MTPKWISTDRSSSERPRMLLLEDNLRDVGGHYLELAGLLADGAIALGYSPTLVTHQSFASSDESLDDPRVVGLPVWPEFDVRRMENWSLGVDGCSQLRRSPSGMPEGGSVSRRVGQRMRDLCCRPSRGPAAMLDKWSAAFCRVVEQFAPTERDRIVVNTGGDFQMLALSRALANLTVDHPLRIDVVIHFAVYDREATERAERYGQQIRETLESIERDDVRLHATTEGLALQLRSVGVSATAIPYPTRYRAASCLSSPKGAKRIVLAGMQRAEKGRAEIKSLLASIEHDQLRAGKLVWSMQLQAHQSRSVIPESMLDLCEETQSLGSVGTALEVLTGNLSSDDYHRWLDEADIGLFLYDPDRYAVRCSGVLLEMLVRGKPVIVPEGCWLAEHALRYSEDGPIGWTYRDPSEIRSILDRLDGQYDKIASRCQRVAGRIAETHSGRNTLREMGISDQRSIARYVAETDRDAAAERVEWVRRAA